MKRTKSNTNTRNKKRSHEKDAAAINRWTRKRLLGIMGDPCKIALKFLSWHTRGRSAGNPDMFAFHTMHGCTFAGLEIAGALTESSTASLQVRAGAMAVQVAHLLVYPHTTWQIDLDTLKRLLKEEPVDLVAQSELVTLARAAAHSDFLWQGAHEEIKSAIRTIGDDHKIGQPMPLDTPSEIIDAAERCQRFLRVLMSKGPSAE